MVWLYSPGDGWVVLTVEFCLLGHAISFSYDILIIQISHDEMLTVSRRNVCIHVFSIRTGASSDKFYVRMTVHHLSR
jgi:hypothetical protein